jgi:hypothetical protein
MQVQQTQYASLAQRYIIMPIKKITPHPISNYTFSGSLGSLILVPLHEILHLLLMPLVANAVYPVPL